MKKLFTALLMLLVWQVPAGAEKILVKFSQGKLPIEKLSKDSQIKSFKKLPLCGWIILESSGQISQLKQKYSIEAWEPNYSYQLTEVIPNDPFFSNQYGLKNTGQSGGTIGADISAPDAWETTTGSRELIVAVIDTGVDMDHEDLAANIWTNVNDPVGNGDEDGNGFEDDTFGWDFINDDNDPDDDQGHGTHVAGIIGALGNNGIGVSGVNWNVTLMALKVFGIDGEATLEDIIPSIVYATDKGAHVINASWGDGVYSLALKEAINNFISAGGLFVAAAGNETNTWFLQDNDNYPYYPASYEMDGMISVGATDRYDTLSAFSCIGYNSVDLFSPGSGVYSTVHNNSYSAKSGTSMAAPFVAGTAALIWSVSPELSSLEIKDRILGNVDRLALLNGKCWSGGRLNAAAVFEVDKEIPGQVLDLEITGSGFETITLEWTAPSDFLNGATKEIKFYEVRCSTELSELLNWTDASRVLDEPVPDVPGSVESMTVNGLNAGTEYYFGLKALDSVGNRSLLSNHVSVKTLPLYPIFSDDVESGTGEWGVEPTWTVISDDSVSGDNSWTDSPLAPYSVNTNSALMSPSISLVGSSNTVLQFQHKFDIEPRGQDLLDAANLEVYHFSQGWEVLEKYFDSSSKWHRETFDLSWFDGKTIQIRFRLVTNASDPEGYFFDGWSIDDIQISSQLPLYLSVPEEVWEVSR